MNTATESPRLERLFGFHPLGRRLSLRLGIADAEKGEVALAESRLLPLAIPLLALVLGWRQFDRSRYRVAEDFSRTLLATLPPGAEITNCRWAGS